MSGFLRGREDVKKVKQDNIVTVIIPAYNAEKYISKCLDSVLEQSYKKFLIYLVNDGSTDRTMEIACKYEERFPNVIKIFSKENGGQASARNYGIDRLTTEYVTFLDSDDYVKPDYLEVLVREAEYYQADMICSGQYKITEDGKILKTISYHPVQGKCLNRRLNISGKLYRTAYLDKWNIRFPLGKTYEDNSFNLQSMFLTDKCFFVDYEGYYQVVHEGSTTSKVIDAARLPFDEWEMICRNVRDNESENVDKELFDFTFMSFLTYFLMVRNRKREYLPNENKKVLMDSVHEITDFCQKMIKINFKGYGKNRYLNIFKNRELPFSQKAGTFIFWFCARTSTLKLLVDMVYKLI